MRLAVPVKSNRKRKAATSTRRRPPPPQMSDEWAGGCASLPVYVREQDAFRPAMMMWVAGEVPVAAEPSTPGLTDAEIGAALAALLQRPAMPVSPPRRLRVASPAVAEVLRAAVPRHINVIVGPTPEVDNAIAQFLAALPDLMEGVKEGSGVASYMSGGIAPEAVQAFFEAMCHLFQVAPWDILPTDEEVVGLDIPAVGLVGACVSIMGQMGLEYGAIVHTSNRAFRRFLRRAERATGSDSMVGDPLLALTFTPPTDLPGQMVSEVKTWGWPLPVPDLYPTIMNLDASGTGIPMTLNVLVRATAAAEALACFFEKHPKPSFSIRSPTKAEFVVEALAGKPTATVTTPCPLEQSPLVNAASSELPKSTRAALKTFLGKFWSEAFVRRFPDVWDAAQEDVNAVLTANKANVAEVTKQLASLPLMWAICHRPMNDGSTGLEHAAGLPEVAARPMAAALARLKQARGVFVEVVDVDPESGRVVFRDLFDGSLYPIQMEVQFTEMLTRHRRMFGVVVELGKDEWDWPSILFSRVALQELSPAGLLAEAKKALEILKIDPSEIRVEAPHQGLARWSAVVAAQLHTLPEPAEKMQMFKTSEGHLAKTCTVRFQLPQAAIKKLFAVDREDVLRGGSDQLTFVDRSLTKLYSEGETIGTLVREKGFLTLSTMSEERTQRLLTEVIRLSGVEPKKITASATSLPGSASAPGENVEEVIAGVSLPTEVSEDWIADDLVLDRMLRQLDRPIPFLGGTPREVVATEEGRVKVQAWLRTAELAGNNGPGAQFLDLDPCRVVLGLPKFSVTT